MMITIYVDDGTHDNDNDGGDSDNDDAGADADYIACVCEHVHP